jgi:hypothetical protein
MLNDPLALTPDELRRQLHAFCERRHIRRLEVFGSAARSQATPFEPFTEFAKLSGAPLQKRFMKGFH